MANMYINNRTKFIKNSKGTYAVCGYRKDIDAFVNSTYEANVYRIFQYHNKQFKYEQPFRILCKDGTKHYYFVDLLDIEGLLAEPGTYIEIKGYMDKWSQEKILLFREQYPNLKLITLGKQHNSNNWIYDIYYEDLVKKYKSLIPLWETTKQNLYTNPELYK